MIEEKVVYFEKPGPENTRDTLTLALEAAEKLGIRTVIVATGTGSTPLQIENVRGLDIVVVSTASGQREPGVNKLSSQTREALLARGYHVVTAAHALSGVERSFSTTFGGVYPAEVMAHTLRMFCAGVKVCVEIAAMAADAGYAVGGEPVIAVAGTAQGADTAVVLRPEVSAKILSTRVDRIICKPFKN